MREIDLVKSRTHGIFVVVVVVVLRMNISLLHTKLDDSRVKFLYVSREFNRD